MLGLDGGDIRGAPWVAVAAMAGLAAGCGDPVSLDAMAMAESSTSTTAIGSSSGSTGHVDPDGDSMDDDPARPDVADLPGDPGQICGAGCDLELRRIWVWKGDLPLPSHEQSAGFSTMTTTQDGSVVVAEKRGEGALISGISSNGEHQWSVPFDLSCGCEVIDMAQSTYGDIAFIAEGGPDLFQPRMVVGRFSSTRGSGLWTRDLYPFGFEERWPRAGGVVPMTTNFWGPGTAGALVIQPQSSPSPPLQERVELYRFDAFANVEFPGLEIDTQRETLSGARPVGAEVGESRLAVAFPAFTGQDEQEEGYLIWLDSLGLVPSDAQPLPGVPDAVDVGPAGRTLVASHVVPEPGTLELQLGMFSPDLPPVWETVRIIETDTARVQMSADAVGRIHVAVHIEREREGQLERGVEVLSFDDEGALRWRRMVPLDIEPDMVMEISAGGWVLIAGTVGERAHVERIHPLCTCDD